MGSQRLGSCSGTLNCSWHFLPWSCAGDVAWSRNVQVVPFPLLSSLPALLGWSESQRRTLGEACRGQHLLVSEQPRVGEDWFESKRDQESAHSSYSSLLGNMMEENTCVCLGWGLRGGGGGGGLKLRDVLYFPARRLEVYAGLIFSFQTKKIIFNVNSFHRL